jgi:N-acetylglucosaminyl-diphospho-decaprenol L-rhamnosyltransferase
VLRSLQTEIAQLRPLRNDLGRGVLNAMKAGIAAARGEYVLVSGGLLPVGMSRSTSASWADRASAKDGAACNHHSIAVPEALAVRGRTHRPRLSPRTQGGDPIGPEGDHPQGRIVIGSCRGDAGRLEAAYHDADDLEARGAAGGQGLEGWATSVDFVVVAYRSAGILGACLDSIAADLAGTSAEAGWGDGATVIVVDNASPDDSAAVARAHSVGATVIESAVNAGFGSGCNLGAAAGRSANLFFLNPDARLTPGTTSRLLQELDQEPTLGAIGPALSDPKGDYRAASAGFEPSLRSIIGHFLLLGRVPGLRRWFRPLQLPEGSGEHRPDWVSGAALVVRREAFEEVRGFDESMFLYMEDVDLCRRLRERRWRIGYEPGVVVTHELGGTQGSEQAGTWARAFYRYMARLHGATYARVCSILAAIGLGLRAVAYLPKRRALGLRLARAARAFADAAVGVRATTVVPE